MASLTTSELKRRQPVAAASTRSSVERLSGSWQALPGSETLAPCHGFIGRNLGIAKGQGRQYVPARGSS